MGAALEWRGVSKRFGRTTALQDVDLEIAPGQITAILGENGAGKTTLINLALGLVKPGAGSVRVGGAAAGSRAARSHLGVMLQQAALPGILTGRELIELAASYYRAPVSPAAIVDQLGISRIADKRAKSLSGGQQRQIQFALAMVGRPDTVFLDEPTTGLDTDARARLWDTVRETASQDRAIVLTTHYLEEADVLADRIVVLRRGEIIADAPTATLRARVSGSLIRCVTELAPAAAGQLPGVSRANADGRFVEALSTDPPRTLAAWIAADPGLTELTVSQPTLAQALALIDETRMESV